MSQENDQPKPAENMDSPKPAAPVCGPECACHSTKPAAASRTRYLVGAIILLAAAGMVVRAYLQDQGNSCSSVKYTLASPPPAGHNASTKAEPAIENSKELAAFADLNRVAADSTAVFIYLPAKKGTPDTPPMAQMKDAARTIAAKGNKVGLFTLKPDSSDYEKIAQQVTVPGVMALVKGAGMKAVSGEITETKLIQAYVAAMNAGGGCGPSGCAPGSACE